MKTTKIKRNETIMKKNNRYTGQGVYKIKSFHIYPKSKN